MTHYSEEDKICHDCIGEEYLSKEIEKKGRRGKCVFCGRVTRTYTLILIVDRVEQVLLDHYQLTPIEPSDWEYYKQHADKESDYVWYREGQTVEEILLNEFDIREEASVEIASMLEARHSDMDTWAIGEETEFDSGTHYELKGISDERWVSEWERFGNILKTESRFFSEQVANLLATIFDGLENLKTWDGQHVLTNIGPTSEINSLYRARVFQSREKLLDAISKPDILLGPPLPVFAMSGRMNARGIAVFYGATETSVALSEVRPPVGSKVAVGRFQILRTLKLLDLRKLNNIREWVSVFDPQYLEKMEKAVFLRHLAERLTTPVMPDDEDFEYLNTQVIADYLASRTDVNYDGIIYPSVQVSGDKINVVLFHKAARVTPIHIPDGVRLQIDDTDYDEDGVYTSYQVVERIPKRKKKLAESTDSMLEDKRLLSLAVDLNDISVHEIRSVQYEATVHSVTRSRYKETPIGKIEDF
ncbi:RES family NAD+ phosphorylase [Mucilaginibacter roseus]|uniref:RES family NAD+ phosphorylase n=1 Tax=Mucilaginibacter roseus TaxID=1528868 RepID=A0ABS8U1H1_9SPHI|nr:RES domain-containing protein [Mucilaginibacter roseus]MCD8739373.1 RES family NAD+ phosphorylase [Mucilaginibacter roseus]